MAADYAGACAAVKQRFIDNWQSAGVKTTPYAFVNTRDDPTAENPDAWVFFEIVHSGSRIVGTGTAGNQTIVYYAMIKAHVFVHSGDGLGESDGGGLQKAIAIGEIFRNKVFYSDVTAGCYVRSGYDTQGPPRVEEGEAASINGDWFAVTATIPFEYWHRG